MLALLFRTAFTLYLLTLFTCISSLLAQNASTVTECPTWHILVDGKCVCGGGAVKCLPDGKVAIVTATCMTYNDGELFLGDCPYTANSTYLNYVTLPSNVSKLNEFMCGGRNRTGFLCNQCRDNLTLAALSYTRECIECSDADVRKGIVLFLVFAFTPTTAFFLLVMLCMRDITSGPTNAVLIIIQITMAKTNLQPPSIILSSASNNPMHHLVILVLSIFGIFNLDFLRYGISPFCISKSLTTLQAQLLEYAIAVYPLLILTVTYIFVELHDRGNCIIATLWNPFRKVSRLKCLQHLNVKYSLIITFATFLLLSYTRILFISAGILLYSNVQDITGKTVRKVLFVDASVTYLSSNHIPYMVLAIFMNVVFNLLPLLLLFLYPTKCFQHLLGCFPNVNWHPLRAFMDIFQGCYKNGTNGTRDYRYFSALNFVVRIIYAHFI